MSQPRHRPHYVNTEGLVVTRRMTRKEKRLVTRRKQQDRTKTRDEIIEELFVAKPLARGPRSELQTSESLLPARLRPLRRRPRTQLGRVPQEPAKPSDAVLQGGGRKARGYYAALTRFRKFVAGLAVGGGKADDDA